MVGVQPAAVLNGGDVRVLHGLFYLLTGALEPLLEGCLMFMEEVSAPTGKELDLQQLFMEEMFVLLSR